MAGSRDQCRETRSPTPSGLTRREHSRVVRRPSGRQSRLHQGSTNAPDSPWRLGRWCAVDARAARALASGGASTYPKERAPDTLPAKHPAGHGGPRRLDVTHDALQDECWPADRGRGGAEPEP
ncbi:hypothetical protein HIM_04920 [Hirsutella minnesotensis 3608]|uniref:Uncharacterized protein n=1 Tax=Hirsutella minnesotensis 3608 TaxID=1043627 RepID=A0A0F7ZV03_9HYPO|nr:hypothetical protein HIM_04920 [Hirsutella minnesotensis 3608]